MNSIVICSQCGFQTESNKRFCPNCGAPIGPLGHTQIDTSVREVAASTLFSRLQDKKEQKSEARRRANSTATTYVSSPKPVAAVTERKGRPTIFTKKPLGVAKPIKTRPSSKSVVLTKGMQNQLIQFLRGLNKLDRNLEASAVVKRDGTLLASAHSSRAKPEMMATISSTLYGIAKDSIRAISGGKMRMVSIMAEQSVLMLTKVNEDTILLIVTSPKSNIGLISMYSELIAQNISKFLSKIAL
ncbi:MAG: roadblock/LC7 domain-containing protein [Candidatus Helarchaeota archaeon]|nr:roadblock/LC7 domain-containing protein [Candidatus Helarchaeota archaeon]